MTSTTLTNDEAMRQQVEEALEMIRPALMMDGGDCELVDVQDGIIKIRMMGACHGCGVAEYTLQMGIEQILLEYVPEMRGLEAVDMLGRPVFADYLQPDEEG
jgi:Fe-S cluster biogenesis protein NfuA